MKDSDNETKMPTADKRFLYMIMFLLYLFLISFFLMSCSHKSVLDYDSNSICALDFKTESCWIERKKQLGMTFSELEAQNNKCDDGPPDYCWFAVNHIELATLLRAQEKLNRCEAEK